METKVNVKLKSILFGRGISQRQLAFQLGVDENSISRLIRYNIGPDSLRDEVAKVIGVDRGELFGE